MKPKVVEIAKKQSFLFYLILRFFRRFAKKKIKFLKFCLLIFNVLIESEVDTNLNQKTNSLYLY